MDDSSPQFFESLRRQFMRIPNDDLVRIDKHQLRAFAVECLLVCEELSQQLMGGDPDVHPIFTSRLTLRLEKFSGPTA